MWASVVAAHALSFSTACGARDQEAVSPALAGGILTTGTPREDLEGEVLTTGPLWKFPQVIDLDADI